MSKIYTKTLSISVFKPQPEELLQSVIDCLEQFSDEYQLELFDHFKLTPVCQYNIESADYTVGLNVEFLNDT